MEAKNVQKKGGFLSTNQATIYGCYLGYIVQGIINNVNPILFVTYQQKLGVSLESISLLIILNFGAGTVRLWPLRTEYRDSLARYLQYCGPYL